MWSCVGFTVLFVLGIYYIDNVQMKIILTGNLCRNTSGANSASLVFQEIEANSRSIAKQTARNSIDLLFSNKTIYKAGSSFVIFGNKNTREEKKHGTGTTGLQEITKEPKFTRIIPIEVEYKQKPRLHVPNIGCVDMEVLPPGYKGNHYPHVEETKGINSKIQPRSGKFLKVKG